MTATLSELHSRRLDRRVRWTFGICALLIGAFLVSLIVRRAGSYYPPLDGWGVDLFELSMGAICIGRYYEGSWRSSPSAARVLPLVLGAACLSWALGDVAHTFESFGGATPPSHRRRTRSLLVSFRSVLLRSFW